VHKDFNDLAGHRDATITARAPSEIDPLRASLATDLKSRAEHYRRLADMLFDERVTAIVRDCATELEREARVIENTERHSFSLKHCSIQHGGVALPTLE